MSAIVRALRPGQEPPEPPKPPEPVVLTGSVCLTPSERAALSEINGIAQQLARLNHGPSATASKVSEIPTLIEAGGRAFAKLQLAHEAANNVRSAS